MTFDKFLFLLFFRSSRFNIYIERDDLDNIVELDNTDVETVIKYVKQMSVYKSSGIGDLGSKLLKDIFLYIPEILVDIFNKVLVKNSFPDSQN